MRTAPYYLSQYLWLLYIVIPILFSIIFPKIQSRVKVHSSNEFFNISCDPIIFAHITDSHISTLIKKHTDSYRQVVDLLKYSSPEFIIHTGDMVDNYDSLSMLRYGKQDENNWKIYQKETEKIDYIPTIEMGGNHDMFGIKSALSHQNFIMDYSHSFNRNNTKSEDDFKMHSFKMGSQKINIIVLNPFHFPTGHPPLLLYTRYTKKYLNRLEEEIEKSPTKSVIVGHYPVGSISSKKSSKGNRFTDIIGSNPKVLAYLSGHSHPKNVIIYHHGKGGIEYLGPASFLGSKFGLLSIDNNAIVWTTMDPKKKAKGVITYPVPKEQVTPHTIFNDHENAQIRVVMFSTLENHSIIFTAFHSSSSTPTCVGFMNFSRKLPNNHTLYIFPIKKCYLKEGNYLATFSGDFDGRIEFLIGDEFKTHAEKYTEYPRIIQMLMITFPIFYAILFIITVIIPFDCCNCNSKLEDIEKWVETGEGSNKWWYVVTFVGFIVMRVRFQQIPLPVRIIVFVLLLYGLFGPLLFFETEDLIGFVWLYGYCIQNRALPSNYGLIYDYIYIGVVCFPMIVLCSSFGAFEWSIKQVGDIVLACACIVVDVIILIRIVHETSGNRLTATSIGFIYIPLIFIVLAIVWLTVFRKKDKKDQDRIMKENRDGISNQVDKKEKSDETDDDHETPIELRPIKLHSLENENDVFV